MKTKTPLYLFLTLVFLTLALWLLSSRQQPNPGSVPEGATTIPLLLGSFTTDPPQNEKDGQGMYLIEYDPEEQKFSDLRLLATVDNPSYAALTEDGRVYAALRGGEEDVLHQFKWEAQSRNLKAMSPVPAAGSSPCYVALHPDLGHVVVANYESGTASVYTLDQSSGAPLINTQQVVSHSGSGGPDVERQSSAHAHWAQWNAAGDRLYIVDLGIDKVMMYPFDKTSGKLGVAQVAFAEEPGAGPRHMAFHPSLPAAYLLNELNSTLTFMRVENDGSLSKIKTLSTLPEGYEGPNQTAHIAINKTGTTLYASNRGHNSIIVVKLAEDGAMNIIQTIGAGGNWPRYFTLFEEYNTLIVANVRSNNLAVLDIQSDGRLKRTNAGAFAPKPNFVAMLKQH